MLPQLQLIGRPEMIRYETGTVFPDTLQNPATPESSRTHPPEPVPTLLVGRGPQNRDIQLDSTRGSVPSLRMRRTQGAGERERGGSPEEYMDPIVLV